MALQTMKARKALDYLAGVHNHIKNNLSEDIKNYLDEGGYDFFDSIDKCKSLIEDRMYMMEHDDEDYIMLNNMRMILQNHYKLFTMIENGLIRNNTLIQIDMYNL